MRRFIIKILLIAVLPVVAIMLRMLLITDDYSRRSHGVNLRLAYNKLDKLSGTQKIVIIAGSNGGFGFNSKILSDSMHMPVVNTSVHASIGVRMQFEIYKDLLERGDIVIFCPEYYNGKGRLYGGEPLLRIVSTHMPSAYLKMSVKHWQYSLKYVWQHYLEAIEHRGMTKDLGIFAANAINEYGDMAMPREHKPTLIHYGLIGSMDEETAEYYRYIHRFAKEKGIKLVYLPPTFCESNYRTQKAKIQSLAKQMSELGIPYMAPPERFVYADSLYYDTSYHLTTHGAELRTKAVIEILREL